MGNSLLGVDHLHGCLASLDSEAKWPPEPVSFST